MLTPVLQPPKVKEYLSTGERFIKWDDVSTWVFPLLGSVCWRSDAVLMQC